MPSIAAFDSEIPSLICTFAWAIRERATSPRRRRRPEKIARILVAPHLRLGDALLVTPLLAKLRMRYPHAEIVLLSTLPMLPLYQARPYGVTIWPYHPRRFATVTAMMANKGFDLAILPGDNRHAWLALALDAKWIVAHSGDRPRIKNWPVDEFIDYPDTPMAMGEIFAELIPGEPPAPFTPGDWPKPAHTPFDLPGKPYALLHAGASSAVKFWPAAHWRALAQRLTERGYDVVWSCGPGEHKLLAEVSASHSTKTYPGTLDLAQMWHLIAGAALFISPDTGVAHLARLTGTPSVVLFGPGSPMLFGRGRFWQNTPSREVAVPDMHCRDQGHVFNRHRSWIKRCGRTPRQCVNGISCMNGIVPAMVESAIDSLTISVRHVG